MNNYLILGILMVFSCSGCSKSISFKKGSSSYLEEKLRESLSLLPPYFLNKGKGSIHIEVSAFNTDKLIDEDLCKLPSKAVLANTSQIFRSDKIKISSRLIDLAQTNKKKFACSHKTFERVLLANIIHELTYVQDSYERISRKAEFQRISGFIKKGSKVRLNQINDANNFKEALAINVEYMVLDEEFECRKPATALFLVRTLNIPKHNKCQRNFNVITQSTNINSLKVN